MQNTALAQPDATPHPEWCRNHDDEGNVCLGDTVHLDFRADGRLEWLTDWAAAGLGYCPDEGADVFVDFPGRGATHMTPADAGQLGRALIALEAAALRAGAL
jgi:hypothetical protein